MSAIEVHLAPLLQSYSRGKKIVAAEGSTLAEVLLDLDRQFPGIRFRVVDEQDRARPHVRFFVNQDDVRELGSVLAPGDQIFIVGALSGG